MQFHDQVIMYIYMQIMYFLVYVGVLCCFALFVCLTLLASFFLLLISHLKTCTIITMLYIVDYAFPQSVVFDLPNALVSTVEQYWKDGYMTLTECTQLPELQDRPSDYYQRLRNNDRGESWLWGG